MGKSWQSFTFTSDLLTSKRCILRPDVLVRLKYFQQIHKKDCEFHVGIRVDVLWKTCCKRGFFWILFDVSYNQNLYHLDSMSNDTFDQFRFCSFLLGMCDVSFLNLNRFISGRDGWSVLVFSRKNMYGKVEKDHVSNFRRPKHFQREFCCENNTENAENFWSKSSILTINSAMRIRCAPILVQKVRNQSFLMPYFFFFGIFSLEF